MYSSETLISYRKKSFKARTDRGFKSYEYKSYLKITKVTSFSKSLTPFHGLFKDKRRLCYFRELLIHFFIIVEHESSLE